MASRSSSAIRTFRLATINVHGFHCGPSRGSINNVNELVSILNLLNLDSLAIEEVVNDENWTNFCEKLSLKYFMFDAIFVKFDGIGFASRYPIRSSFSQRASFSCPGGTRGILQCSLDIDHPSIICCNTS